MMEYCFANWLPGGYHAGFSPGHVPGFFVFEVDRICMPSVRLKENEYFDAALRRFKRACEKAGILTELRRREFEAYFPRFSSTYTLVLISKSVARHVS
jgi:hypothetical protein